VYGVTVVPDRPDRLSDRPPKDRQGLQLDGETIPCRVVLGDYVYEPRYRCTRRTHQNSAPQNIALCPLLGAANLNPFNVDQSLEALVKFYGHRERASD
jgi:hypothetical protein